jgi:hypothetical protein
MIDKLYGKYFQKSKSFLYPALGIKKTSYKLPSNTYLSFEGKIGLEDIKLICTFDEDDSEGFKSFESEMLIGNPLFLEKIQVKDSNLYIFDLQIYEADWFNFVLGRYSKLSSHLKRAIKTYYGEKSSEYKYIETYLYPSEHFETYAKLLNVDINLLKEVGELCNGYDCKKETLKIPVEDLECLKKI